MNICFVVLMFGFVSLWLLVLFGLVFVLLLWMVVVANAHTRCALDVWLLWVLVLVYLVICACTCVFG